MAVEEQGIIIRFGADTIKLSESLDSVNRAIKVLQTQFNNLQKDLKRSPDGVEGVKVLEKEIENTKKQMEYLGKATELYQQRLRALKKQIEEGAFEKPQDRAKAEKEAAALASALSDAEQHMKSLKDRADAVEARLKEITHPAYNIGKAFKAAGEEIESIGKALTGIGRSLQPFSRLATTGLTGIYNSAKDFESAFVGVMKTVDETATTSYKDLERTVRSMATELPSTAAEISEVMEMLGQLGVRADDIEKFTKVMIDLGNATNVDATEGAATLAQLYNVMRGDFDTVDQFGAALTALGNNSATTEKDILDMSKALGSAASTLGFDMQSLLGLSTTLASTGLSANRAGNSLSKIFINIDKDISNMTDDESLFRLKQWGTITGMTATQFANLWRTDVNSALKEVIHGLGTTVENGKDLNLFLDDVNVKELRATDVMRRLTKAYEKFDEYIVMSNDEWDKNTALVNEANRRYATAESQLQILRNELTEVGIKLGEDLLPTLKDAVKVVKPLVEEFGYWAKNNGDLIVKLLGIVAVSSPLMKVLGNLTTGLGKAFKFGGKVAGLMAKGTPLITAITTALGPMGIAGAIAAVTVGLGALAIKWYESNRAAIKLRSEVKNLNSEYQTLDKEARESFKAREREIKQGEYYAKQIDDLVAKLKEEGLTEDERANIKGRISSYIDELNSALGTEAFNFDSANDKLEYQGQLLDSTTQKYEELAGAARRQAWIDANATKYAEAIDSVAEAEDKLVDAEKIFGDSLSKISYGNLDLKPFLEDIAKYSLALARGRDDQAVQIHERLAKAFSDEGISLTVLGNVLNQSLQPGRDFNGVLTETLPLIQDGTTFIEKYSKVLENPDIPLEEIVKGTRELDTTSIDAYNSLKSEYDMLNLLAGVFGTASNEGRVFAEKANEIKQALDGSQWAAQEASKGYDEVTKAGKTASGDIAEDFFADSQLMSDDVKKKMEEAYAKIEEDGGLAFVDIKNEAEANNTLIGQSISEMSSQSWLTFELTGKSAIDNILKYFKEQDWSVNFSYTRTPGVDPSKAQNNYAPVGGGGLRSGGFGDINITNTFNVQGNPSRREISGWAKQITYVVNQELGKRVR